jgi:hypothetical protein
MKLFGKTKMQKSETALAALNKRASLLSDKRAGAQAALDHAVNARQEQLLGGDLEDQKLAAKLQTAVESAQSALVGLDGAISALQVQIDSAEKDLTAERERVERQAASESLAASVASIESKLEPWLASTRSFAESLQSISHIRFEPGQIAAYIGGCAGQVEIAAAVMLDDLHRLVPAIAAGHEPIPRVPGVVVSSPAPPKPVTVRLFAMNPVKWTDAAGMQRFVHKYNDVDLPEKAADFARGKGVCVELADPRRKQLKGLSPGHPEPHWCLDLDNEATVDDTTAPATELEPIKHSAFTPVDRGAPYLVKTHAGTGEAA